MRILITGAAGYIGGMLTELFLNEPTVEKVVALDMKDKKEAIDRFPEDNQRFAWIKWNLGDDGWQEKVLKEGPMDVVIHCAYIIRQQYGKKRQWQIKSNITAAEKLFDFVFGNKIKKLIHFSTVAAYGASATNSVSHLLKETDPLKEERYLYGVDKKKIEKILEEKFDKERARPSPIQVIVLRLASVTGPRGQHIVGKLGLLKAIKSVLPIVPVIGSQSARQYIHEDDIAEVAKMLIMENKVQPQYEVFNTAPPDFILLQDLAKENGKWVIRIPLWLGRLGFFILWHFTRGRIDRTPKAIENFAYPIIVDGSKIAQTGFQYRYQNCREIIKADKGKYAERAGLFARPR